MEQWLTKQESNSIFCPLKYTEHGLLCGEWELHKYLTDLENVYFHKRPKKKRNQDE